MTPLLLSSRRFRSSVRRSREARSREFAALGAVLVCVALLLPVLPVVSLGGATERYEVDFVEPHDHPRRASRGSWLAERLRRRRVARGAPSSRSGPRPSRSAPRPTSRSASSATTTACAPRRPETYERLERAFAWVPTLAAKLQGEPVVLEVRPPGVPTTDHGRPARGSRRRGRRPAGDLRRQPGAAGGLGRGARRDRLRRRRAPVPADPTGRRPSERGLDGSGLGRRAHRVGPRARRPRRGRDAAGTPRGSDVTDAQVVRWTPRMSPARSDRYHGRAMAGTIITPRPPRGAHAADAEAGGGLEVRAHGARRRRHPPRPGHRAWCSAACRSRSALAISFVVALAHALHAQPPVGLHPRRRATRSTSAARACATCSPRASPTRAPRSRSPSCRTLLGIPELAVFFLAAGVMACISFTLLHLWVFHAAPGEARVSRPLVSVVVPCLNEEDNVGPLYERVRATLVGGRGRLRGHLQPRPLHRRDRGPHPRDPRCSTRAVKMLRLSRRFGQPAATLAGIRMASGDAVVVIDCDLQDPPELIGDMIGALVARASTSSTPSGARAPARRCPSASSRRSATASSGASPRSRSRRTRATSAS